MSSSPRTDATVGPKLPLQTSFWPVQGTLRLLGQKGNVKNVSRKKLESSRILKASVTIDEVKWEDCSGVWVVAIMLS